jgi:hypothetical protein
MKRHELIMLLGGAAAWPLAWHQDKLLALADEVIE